LITLYRSYSYRSLDYLEVIHSTGFFDLAASDIRYGKITHFSQGGVQSHHTPVGTNTTLLSEKKSHFSATWLASIIQD
jgi:hypothetical protein